LKLRFRFARYRSKKRMGKLSPNSRADLRYLLGGAKPIKPRH
jgi:hypothetical protein